MGPKRVIQAHLKNLIYTASGAEAEVERFLRKFLPGTEFAGKTKAVGGYVRDQYLSQLMNDPSIEAKDLDILVEMKDGAEKLTHFIYDSFNKPSIWNNIKKFFKLEKKESPVSTPRQMGKDYPIWQITFKQDINYKGDMYNTQGAIIEFADTMKEEYPDPESRQRKVLPSDLEGDIARRDFTTNMLLKDLTTGEIEDLTGQSKEDIKKGILRGHPKVSLDEMFSKDPLRMLRLIRFQAKYDWHIPKSVLKAVKRNAHRIDIISGERIREELTKVMKMGKLKQAVRIMSVTNLLKHVFPEVEALKKVTQPEKWHSEGNVYKHTLMVLHNAKPGIEYQMAALLHDTGKPAVREILEDEIHFYGHENVSAEITQAIMDRLKFDKKTTDKVVTIVRNHMKPLKLNQAGEKALRKFIREIGDELVDAIIDMAKADELGALPNRNFVPDLITKIDKIRKAPVKIVPKPVLTGTEIMELLGLKQGPEVGKAKEYLLDLQDDFASKQKELPKEEAKTLLLKEFKK